MSSQMIRVISSPSSSTMVFWILIVDMFAPRPAGGGDAIGLRSSARPGAQAVQELDDEARPPGGGANNGGWVGDTGHAPPRRKAGRWRTVSRRVRPPDTRCHSSAPDGLFPTRPNLDWAWQLTSRTCSACSAAATLDGRSEL